MTVQSQRYRIGLFAEVTNNYYFRNVVRGMTDHLRVHGSWHVVGDQMSDLDGEAVLAGAVDGVLVDFARRDHLIPYMLRATVPVVNISTRSEPMGPFPHVRPDHHLVGRVVAEHFLDRGFRRFGYYGPSDNQFSIDRATGFIGRLSEAGFECEADRRVGYARAGLSAESRALVAWVSRLEAGTAIMAATDVYGWHVLAAAQAAQRRVPEELAVCGVDNDESMCELVTPPLTSVPLDGRQTGRIAAELLGQLMAGKAKRDDRLILVPPLPTVARRSSDILAVDDPDVAMALLLVRDRAATPGGLSAAAVTDAATISRSLLERRFKAAMGRSIQEEIWRVQLAKARDLLRETDLPMPAVAKASGFRSAVRFSEAFRRLDGRPPTAYRSDARGVDKANAP
jgi:LacI family transcriptional regulator